MESSSTSSSLVSKAKTAFHSAAAKAEKVLTDIKADLKTDREIEGEFPKSSKKLSEPESIPITKEEELHHESKHHRWKPTRLGRTHDWHDRLKNIRIRKSESEDKERIENLKLDGQVLDEYLGQMDQEGANELKCSKGGATTNEVDSNVITKAKFPPSSVIRQLAVAVEGGKKYNSVKDLMSSARDSSPVRERMGLSFSAVKSLMLRDKEEKVTSELCDDNDFLSLINSVFEAEEHDPERKNGSSSVTLTMAPFSRDIHAAPLESFTVRLSEAIGSFKTLRKMVFFWCRVVDELRELWSEGKPVPGVPLDKNPDLNSCLLHQQLQVINCCISRKKRRIIATDSLNSVLRDAHPNVEEPDTFLGMESSDALLFARVNTGDQVLRLGADHPSENLAMLETGEPIYSPVTQEGPLLTEDLLRETEELVMRTGSVGAGCSQLLSDMQAFKAANPGCILEDFVRWHSPPDWTEAEPSYEGDESSDGVDQISRRGHLSGRMQREGNLWRELWETAKPLPAVKQTPLFDEDMAVENILNSFEEILPSKLFEQLFVSLLGAGFIIAEAILSTNSLFSKLFYECKDYIVATCQGNILSDNLDSLCQVYETVETILFRPDDAIKMMKQSEDTTTTGETKRRFSKLSLKFGSKERRNSPSKDQKNAEENSTRQTFSTFFDSKSSIFAKKPPKSNNSFPSEKPTFPDENDWTIV